MNICQNEFTQEVIECPNCGSGVFDTAKKDQSYSTVEPVCKCAKCGGFAASRNYSFVVAIIVDAKWNDSGTEHTTIYRLLHTESVSFSVKAVDEISGIETSGFLPPGFSSFYC